MITIRSKMGISYLVAPWCFDRACRRVSCRDKAHAASKMHMRPERDMLLMDAHEARAGHTAHGSR